MTDKENRDKAVDAFAAAIKARLDEQAAKGKTGWDGDYSANALADELHHDAGLVLASVYMGVNWFRAQRIVDIGARAMMLYFRLGIEPVWRRCEWADAQQHHSRILTGSIGLEGKWSEWIDGVPEKSDMNREYEYRYCVVGVPNFSAK